jgi:hypothetical protein
MTNEIIVRKDELVQIEKLEENGNAIYLMKIANIPIRPYITEIEANRVADYMKIIVNAVIQKIDQNKDLTGKDLVDIKSLTIKERISYLLTIADLPLRGYIEGYEALVHKNFMIVIINEIIRQSSTKV